MAALNMKNHCVPTKLLCDKTYKDLTKIWISQGAEYPDKGVSIERIQLWKFIGIDNHNCIQSYDHPWSYMGLNEWMNYKDTPEEDYPNILSEEKLKVLLAYCVGGW